MPLLIQRLLRPLALGDIARDDGYPGNTSRRILNGRKSLRHLQSRPVLPQVLKLIVDERFAAIEPFTVGCQVAVTVLRDQDENVFSYDFLCRVTIHALRAGIPGGDNAFAGNTENGII